MFWTQGFLSYILISVLVIIPFWRIFEKIGFPPALSLLTVVPIVNLVMLYVVAFSKRPSSETTG
jgi:hypothetical protein